MLSPITLLSSTSVRVNPPLIPLHFEKRIAMGRIVSVPATVEQYLDYAHRCDYRVQYARGYMWSFIEIDEETQTIMGEAAPIHEQVINRLIRLIGNLLDEGNTNFQSFGSNIKVFIAPDKSYYNPDIAFTKGNAEFVKHKFNRKSATSLVNPIVIVEVLSKSTEGFDKTHKLSDYKKIASLQQIIFVEPEQTFVSTYIRQSDNVWLNFDFDKNTDVLPILEEGTILIDMIYKNLIKINSAKLSTLE